MTLTLLLDLDDTLLETNMDAFVPAYFQALTRHLEGRVQPEAMLAALMSGTQLMLASEDPSRTLQEVFEAEFYPNLRVSKGQLTDAIEDYYDRVFPALSQVTKRREGAAELVEWALSKGYRLAVATDPLFPRKATVHRIRWAGLDPDRFDLISSFETFHFSKSHPAYYAEVLGRLGWPEGPVLMVGNDVRRDLMPAQRLGLMTYQIDGVSASESGPFEATRRGDLVDLRKWLGAADFASLEPSFKTPEAILAIMASTPGVLYSLSNELREDQWSIEPTSEDWAVIEVLCHLRDTEIEIHHMQIEMLLEKSKPFIPRPDAGVWAKQRKYLSENGPAALRAFAAARMKTLNTLRGLAEDVWSRQARHAIFGPTDFREIISFMAEHDRMHVRQAWSTLNAL
jgi:FMN phosphatase YigB (HAD superfamily)